MKSILGIGTAIVISTSVFGQSNELKVKGIVYDNENERIPFPVINFHKTSDSSLVFGDAGKEDGSFELTVPEGNYYAEVSFFGMSNYYIKLKQTKGTLDLGKIAMKLTPSAKMKEVNIIADKDQMSLQIDKRVFNVDANLNNQGANATEVLQNIPSITVDADGNVSLRGSQAVRILIDGKLSGFASSAEALQQLQADMIEKVEIITNASARYEAQGESGIINIILKKNKNLGFNGSINLRTGYYPDNGIGANLNYRKNKMNLYGSATLYQKGANGRSTTSQRLQNADTSFLYFQDYKHDRNKLGLNANVGIDYELDKKNILNASFGIRLGNGKNKYYRSYNNYTINNDFLNRNERDEINSEKENMSEASLGYTRKLSKPGGEWKTAFRWYIDKDFEDSNFDENTSNNSELIYDKSNAYITEKLVLAQSDLILPFNKDSKMEAGLRAQFRDFDNDFGYGNLQNNVWVYNPRFNDQFNYNEKVYAGYIMGATMMSGIGIQAGVRAEYSEIYTKQQSLTNGDKRDYFNLFPSLAMSYKKGINTYQLSYSRRINRPGQWDLMPFMKFGDNRTMRIGNPDLDPELTGSYEASMLNTWEKGSLLSSIYYRHTKNKFDRISFLGADGIIYQQSMNIATRDAVGLEFNGNYNVYKWLRLSTGFNFFRETIKGNLNNADFNYDNFSWTNRSSINVSLPKRLRFQLSGNYEAPVVSAQGKRLAMYFMDFGLSKDLMKNKATLGFNVSDILNSRKWRSTVNTPEIQSETMFQWRQRSFRLTFTYRFNQQLKVNPNENLIENNGGGEQ